MFDLNVLCVGQKKPTVNISGNYNIYVNNENKDYKKRKKHYYQIAPFMNFVDGIWYELACTKDELAGTVLCNYIENSKGIYPYWVKSDAVKNDLRPLYIEDKYFQSFKAILYYLIEQSPINTIMFFCRYQSEDKEVTCGTISTEEFFALLNEKEILTNICYIISN